MWRLIATVCLTAAAEFTPDKLDEMTAAIQKTAGELQDKVVSLSKEITPLVSKIPTFPGQMAIASTDEKAAIQKQFKETWAQLCTDIDSLAKVQADVEKEAGDAKDTVAQLNSQVVEMAGNPEQIKDLPTMQHYLGKFQTAIQTLDAADTSAKTYTAVQLSACQKDENGAPAATRLFEMGSLSRPTFHLPSALLGAVGATVIGAALVVFRTMGKSRSNQVALMEEGNLEWAASGWAWYRTLVIDSFTCTLQGVQWMIQLRGWLMHSLKFNVLQVHLGGCR